MLHAFRANRRFRAHIERALGDVKQELSAGQLSHLDTKALQQVEADEKRSGSKPLLSLRAKDGAGYVFKQCDPALARAEEAAFQLRQLGGRPGVPALVTSIELAGQPPLQGLLKPYIDFQVSAELAADTTTWSDEQRAVMLLEHAWEWFLDNMDTNTSQYALLGPLALPINIDWDRAFSSEGRSEFSRFAKYRAALPNARTFLYADYVAGKIQLPLWMLSAEARRIRRLPRAELRNILTRYAQARFEDAAEREQFVARMSIRQRGIEREVATFMRGLWAERRSLQASAGSAGEYVQHRRLLLWAAWQHVLQAVLRGPIGTGGRRLLSLFRGWRARPVAATPPPDSLPGSEGAR